MLAQAGSAEQEEQALRKNKKEWLRGAVVLPRFPLLVVLPRFPLLRSCSSDLRAPCVSACLPACRYKIEQELGTEIKPIPPVIEKSLYCA